LKPTGRIAIVDLVAGVDREEPSLESVQLLISRKEGEVRYLE